MLPKYLKILQNYYFTHSLFPFYGKCGTKGFTFLLSFQKPMSDVFRYLELEKMTELDFGRKSAILILGFQAIAI